MFKLQVQEDGNNPASWHDISDTNGGLLTFEKEADARIALKNLYPVLVGLEHFAAGAKRTRVLNIIVDDDEDDAK